MPDSQEILKLRVLLCFLNTDADDCTVTGIARTLGKEKYTVSRVFTVLEKEELINRDNIRNPILTEKGYKEAVRYHERIEYTLNHLLYEGVDIESATQDAFLWALYCSDKTMAVVKSTYERYRVKYELRNQRLFNGTTLCKLLKNGSYEFPFIIYREKVKNGNNLSMANDGFEHPCTLQVNDGVGFVQLRAVNMSANSAINGNLLHGKAKGLKYFDNGRFVSSEIRGGILSFPAEALNFVNIGTGVGQVLHGSVCVKMQCTVGVAHMPEATAIFTMII